MNFFIFMLCLLGVWKLVELILWCLIVYPGLYYRNKKQSKGAIHE
jgi:uncharacterized membrane protein